MRPGIDFPEASSTQRGIIETLLRASWLFRSAAASEAQANKLISGSVIDSLPDDFWKREIVARENQILAALQTAMLYYAVGPKALDPDADTYWHKPETDGEKALCAVQRVKKPSGLV
jgi:hypothetical protein